STREANEDKADADWTERLLLEAFSEANLSTGGQQRLRTLRDQFPDADTAVPAYHGSVPNAVGSPIAPGAAANFSDDDWLEAMRRYSADELTASPGGLRGSARELSHVLELQVRLDRCRFAALSHRMDDSLSRDYFYAILNGVCGDYNIPPDEAAR